MVVKRLVGRGMFDENYMLLIVLRRLMKENYSLDGCGNSFDENKKFYLEKGIDIEKVLRVLNCVKLNMMIYMRYGR